MWWPYGKYEVLLHKLNLDWLVRQVKKNTEDIEELQEGGSSSTPHVTAAATVDSNIGTPDVEVVRTGTDLNPLFTFNFSNLKGATGAEGARGADFWRTTVTPTYTSGKFRVGIANLNGVAGDTPRVGDIIFNSYYYYIITELDATYAYAATRTSIQGPQGIQGETGPKGSAVYGATSAPSGSEGNWSFDTYNLTPSPDNNQVFAGDGIFYDGYVYFVAVDSAYNAPCTSRVQIASGGGGGGGSVPDYIFTSNSSSSDETDILASFEVNRIPPLVDSNNYRMYTSVTVEDSNISYLGASYTNLADMILDNGGMMNINYFGMNGQMVGSVRIDYSNAILNITVSIM